MERKKALESLKRDHFVADNLESSSLPHLSATFDHCTTPRTVASKECWEETDRKFDRGWSRTAGPPVVMNPISRQNFIVKDRVEA